MGSHLIDGEFQSDKYPTCPRGKVPLSVRDATAQDLLWQYAKRRRAVDAEFADDLQTALLKADYYPSEDPDPRDQRIAALMQAKWEIEDKLNIADARVGGYIARIAALEAAVAKAEGERQELKKLLSPEVQGAAEYIMRNADRHPDACCSKCAEGLAERDDLRTQLTARDVAGAGLLKALEWIERAAGNCQACAAFRQKAREALATAPAAWRK